MATASAVPLPKGHLLTPDAAEYLGVSVKYLLRLQQEKHQLHPRKFAGRLLWSIEALDAYRAAHPRIGQRRRQQAA